MDRSHYICAQPDLAGDGSLVVPLLGIHERLAPEVIDRPTGNIDYLLMHFHTGCVIETHGDPRVCAPNTCVLWRPGSRQRYGSVDAEWEHSWLHAAGSCVEPRVRAAGIPLDTPFELPDSRLVDTYLPAILTEIDRHSRPDTTIVANHLENWLREIRRQLAGDETADVPPEFLDVKGYLESSFSSRIRLADLAARTFLSVPRFCARFREYFGFTAIDYVVRLRMQQAAFLLRDSSLQVKQVAQRVGYDDIYYFSKLFKRSHGRSPRAYRSSLMSRQPPLDDAAP